MKTMKTMSDLVNYGPLDCYQVAKHLGVTVAKAVEMMEASDWVSGDYNDYGELEFVSPKVEEAE